VGGELGVKPI